MGEIGFALEPGQTAALTEFTVSNIRAPSNRLFSEELQGRPYAGMYRRVAEDSLRF
jgi:hypothetical protein